MGKAVRFALVLIALGLFWVSSASAEKKASGPPLTFSRLILRLDDAPDIELLEGEYRVHILEYLRSAGYNSVGAENLVFDTDNSDKAEFALGGTVREVECIQRHRRDNACYVGIEWQLMHMPTETVVYKVLTRAAEFHIRSLDARDLGRRLILGAVRRLLLRKAFRKVLEKPPEGFARCLNNQCVDRGQIGDACSESMPCKEGQCEGQTSFDFTGFCSVGCASDADCGFDSRGRANVCVSRPSVDGAPMACNPSCNDDSECLAIDLGLACYWVSNSVITGLSACRYTADQ